VTNTGTVTVEGIRIDDAMLEKAGIGITCPETVLAPGQSVTCTAAYTVQAADVASGNPIRNVASAKGSGPDGAVFSPEDDTETKAAVKDEGTPLAVTGGVSLLVAGIGGALLLGGLALALVTRRRRA
jgi:hypothetical protein